MIQISLKIDEESDPVLAQWIMSFRGKRSKELSANIRRILRTHLNSSADSGNSFSERKC
jgi:hypothetical protein